MEFILSRIGLLSAQPTVEAAINIRYQAIVSPLMKTNEAEGQ